MTAAAATVLVILVFIGVAVAWGFFTSLGEDIYDRTLR